MLIAMLVASEEFIERPKVFSRRTFLKSGSQFHTSTGIAGMDHQAVQEVVARPKPDVIPGESFHGAEFGCVSFISEV